VDERVGEVHARCRTVEGSFSEHPPATYLSKASRIADRCQLFPPCSISCSSIHRPLLNLEVDVVKGSRNPTSVTLGLSEELSSSPTERWALSQRSWAGERQPRNDTTYHRSSGSRHEHMPTSSPKESWTPRACKNDTATAIQCQWQHQPRRYVISLSPLFPLSVWRKKKVKCRIRVDRARC